MDWSITFAPLAPAGLVAALAVVGAILAAALLWTRTRGALLRAAALAVLVVAAMNPTISRESRQPLSDIAVIVTDRSPSQQIGQRPRLTDAATRRLVAAVKALNNTELRTVTVTSATAAGSAGTLAFAALKDALADVPPERYAGAIMITDGQIHDVPTDMRTLGYDGPLHAVITGRAGERDRRIVLETAPRFAIVGQHRTIRFRIVDSDGAARGPVNVTITTNGGETRSMSVLPGAIAEVTVPTEHGGKNLVELHAQPLAGELSRENNRAAVVSEGVRDRLRVLLISGKPHPGERTWRNLLKADAAVDLVHFTILRPPEKQDGTPINELSLIAFPTRELFIEKLDQFDLIIFDRYQRRGVLPMSYLANISAYIEQGGAVLVAAGPEFASPLSLYRTPLADVLPARPTGTTTEAPFRPTITAPGSRHPVTATLPGGAGRPPTWGRWFRLIDARAERGHVVMSGAGDKPLLLLSRRGKGRVALMLSDQSWLWARGYEGGGPQGELLRRLAHWLMKEPELEEEALRGRQRGARLVVERRTMADQTDPVDVVSPTGQRRKVTLKKISPGLWQAALAVSETGIYRLSDGVRSAFAAIGSADPRESNEIHASDARIRPVVVATGGGLVWALPPTGSAAPITLPRLVKVGPGRALAGSGWFGLKANGAYKVTAIERYSLATTLLALGLLLALVSAMWYREGR